MASTLGLSDFLTDFVTLTVTKIPFYKLDHVDFQIIKLISLCTLFNALSCGMSNVGN